MATPKKSLAEKKEFTNADKLKIILKNPVLWIETFCKIVDKSGRVVRIKLNPQQRDLLETHEKYNAICKSRQIGCSTILLLEALRIAVSEPNRNCLLVSYSMDSASQIFNKLKTSYDLLPDIIKPKELANNRSELRFSNNSKISVCTMGTKDLGRGATFDFVHISEVAFCKNLETQLTAIEQCLNENGVIYLESTSCGLNEWYTIYTNAVSGTSMYKPYFWSWCQDYVMYKNEFKNFSKRYEAVNGKITDDNLTDEEKDYMKLGATLEMVEWSRMKKANIGEEKFNQEFPATAEISFINSKGTNVFKPQLIQTKLIVARDYKLLKNIPNLPIVLKNYIGSNVFKVWDLPKFNTRYYIGADLSDGQGMDYHAITVFTADLEQVAEFHSNTIQPYIMADIVYNLAKYYNNAHCVIETASGGSVVISRLMNNYNYKNLYRRKDWDARGKQIKKYGWSTNTKSKPIMIQDTVEVFEQNQILIKSDTALKEMRMFQYDENSAEGAQGYHDDLTMAICMAVEGCKNGVNYG